MNIFIAKINFKTKDRTLEDAFAKFGQVTSAKIIRDRDTNKSKGYGFVEMPNDDQAKKAIQELNNSDLDGRAIVVKKAQD